MNNEPSDIRKSIRTYLAGGRVPGLEADAEISFLAAGEYNENYMVSRNGRSFVFRLNHGSQLGLERQIEYEFHVLEALVESGVTPKPVMYDSEPWEGGPGVLLMEYLPGRPLEYRRDGEHAARIFARVHSLPVPEGEYDFVEQPHPVEDIARESYGLLTRYGDHPLPEQGRRLFAYHEEILRLAEDTKELFADERRMLVNTEVNSGNFIINDAAPGQAWLVDWEKAVISNRYQDLGHFVVPTTTLWKTDFRYSDEEKRRFLSRYCELCSDDMDVDEVVCTTEILEKTILLRAFSWSYMAYYEYTQQDRAIKNQDTFETIQYYLNNLECFLP